jgi:uncharacterized protein (TIGR03084 family)
MSLILQQLIDDLAEEHAANATVFATLPPDVWDRPTHAPGWAVRDQVAHLAHFDELAAWIIATGEDAFAALRRNEAGEPSYLERGRAMTPEQVLAWWRSASGDLIAAARTVDPARRLPWGRAMSPASFLSARLMEAWSHGLDVVDVVDASRPDSDRLRHVALIGVNTRPHSYAVRGLAVPAAPVRVELTLPSGEPWTWGDPAVDDRITGMAAEFCQVVTQRRHVADTDLAVTGPVATEWMLVAQAFAGPPGAGRQPGEFRRSPQR